MVAYSPRSAWFRARALWRAATALFALGSGCGYEVFEGLATDRGSISGDDAGGDGGSGRDGGICDDASCAPPSCRNDDLDGNESAVDCGGGCPRCEDGVACNTPLDCKSLVCDASGHCAAPRCDDRTKNGQETDTDCGGNSDSCPRCAVDDHCSEGADCTEHVCSTDTNLCLAPSCDDDTANGDEKGTDCGGSCAPAKRCAAGIPCDRAADCAAPYCLLARCRTPHGNTASPLPGTLQAEDYDEGAEVGFSDTTAENDGSAQVRTDGVDLEVTNDIGGGYNVTKSVAGEWLAFTVSLAEALPNSTIELRTAVRDGVGTVRLEVDEEPVAAGVSLPQTGGTQLFTTVEINGVSLPVGEHVLRILYESAGVNLNWLRVSLPGSAYGGTPWMVPGKIEAEDFDVGGENVGYRSPGGEPTVIYRATGVRLEPCSDAGGGFDVRDTQRNDWLMYTIDVQTTASYRLTARVANTLVDSNLSLEVDDVPVAGDITVPNTGITPTFADVSSAAFPLTAGTHKLKLKFNDGFVSVNWLSLAAVD
jgi:hypothetical protein